MRLTLDFPDAALGPGIEDLVYPQAIEQAWRGIVAEHRAAEKLRGEGLRPRHRILLTAPTGMGKTAFANALARALRIPLARPNPFVFFAEDAARQSENLCNVMRSLGNIGGPLVLVLEAVDKWSQAARTMLRFVLESLPAHRIVVAETNRLEAFALADAVLRRFDLHLEWEHEKTGVREGYTPEERIRLLDTLVRRFGWEEVVEDPGIQKGLLATFRDWSPAKIEQYLLDLRRREVVGTHDAAASAIETLRALGKRRVATEEGKEKPRS